MHRGLRKDMSDQEVLKILRINDRNIKQYSYRDRSDLSGLVLGDVCETIGEGAFRYCVNLKSITVGRGIKSVGMSAFESIGRQCEVIWLSKTPYKNPFCRIFSGTDVFKYICAPFQPFPVKDRGERAALAAGYILHPEYEKDYPEDVRQQYLTYIKEELMQDLVRFSEKGLMTDILLKCLERDFISDDHSLQNFISYARMRVISKEEKKILDGIEERRLRPVLYEGQAPVSDRDKILLRYIELNTNEYELKEMECEIPGKLPSVYYKDGEAAPADALKFILYRYIMQCPAGNSNVPLLYYDVPADKVAGKMDKRSLEDALSQILPEDQDMCGPGYIRRLIPAIRFAGTEMLERITQNAQAYGEYEKYGLQGMKARKIYRHSLILNESDSVPLLAFRCGMLGHYAALHDKDRILLLCRIDKDLRAEDPDEAYEIQSIRELFTDWLYDCYVTASTVMAGVLRNYCSISKSFAGEAEGILWKEADSERYFYIGDTELSDEVYVLPAHPAEMTDEEIEKRNNKASFEQLYLPEIRYPAGLISDELAGKYEGIRISEDEIRGINGRGFILKVSSDLVFELSFYGKTILKGISENGIIETEKIRERSFSLREINEAMHLIDRKLCVPLIYSGRISAYPYVKDLDTGTIEMLVRKTSVNHDSENTAVLLSELGERKCGRSGINDSDLDI